MSGGSTLFLLSETVTIAEQLYEALINRSKVDAPLEAVGLLGAKDGIICAFTPAHNHSPTPQIAFYVEDYAVRALVRELTMAGFGVAGFYHSHTDGREGPSRMDVQMCPPEWLMVIVTDEDVRAFDSDGKELTLRVMEEVIA